MSDFVGMKKLVSGDPSFVSKFHEICDQRQHENDEWIAKLRAQGFKAAHPNDGWVDRTANVVTFCYPHFNDCATTGDKVMLGWSGEQGHLRPIRLLDAIGGDRFLFEDLLP